MFYYQIYTCTMWLTRETDRYWCIRFLYRTALNGPKGSKQTQCRVNQNSHNIFINPLPEEREQLLVIVQQHERTFNEFTDFMTTTTHYMRDNE